MADYLNTGWKYYQPIWLNPAAGSGSGYCIPITITMSQLDGNANSDFSDLRFTARDGSTDLPYKVTSSTAGVTVSLLVRVADDLTTNSTFIYVYWGNSSATSASSNSIYDFYDDATSDGSANYTQRSIGNGNLGTLAWDSTNKRYTVVASLDNLMYEILGNAGTGGYELVYDWAMSSTSGVSNQAGMACRYSSSGLYYLSDYQRSVSLVKKLWIVREPNPPNAQYVDQGVNTVPAADRIATQILNTYKSVGTFYTFTGRVYGSNLYCGESLDGLSTSCTDTTYSSGSLGLFFYSGGATIFFKNVKIRKYTSPEPTVSSIGWRWNHGRISDLARIRLSVIGK